MGMDAQAGAVGCGAGDFLNWYFGGKIPGISRLDRACGCKILILRDLRAKYSIIRSSGPDCGFKHDTRLCGRGFSFLVPILIIRSRVKASNGVM